MLHLIFIKNNKSHKLFVCVFGCVYVFQVLCCVDKQGILSWPSPNPEKILFFSKSTSSQETERQRQKERERDKEMEEVGLQDAIQVKKTKSIF